MPGHRSICANFMCCCVCIDPVARPLALVYAGKTTLALEMLSGVGFLVAFKGTASDLNSRWFGDTEAKIRGLTARCREWGADGSALFLRFRYTLHTALTHSTWQASCAAFPTPSSSMRSTPSRRSAARLGRCVCAKSWRC
jgi:hypothetical protein